MLPVPARAATDGEPSHVAGHLRRVDERHEGWDRGYGPGALGRVVEPRRRAPERPGDVRAGAGEGGELAQRTPRPEGVERPTVDGEAQGVALGMHAGDGVPTRVAEVLGPRRAKVRAQPPPGDGVARETHVHPELAPAVIHEHVLADP